MHQNGVIFSVGNEWDAATFFLASRARFVSEKCWFRKKKKKSRNFFWIFLLFISSRKASPRKQIAHSRLMKVKTKQNKKWNFFLICQNCRLILILGDSYPRWCCCLKSFRKQTDKFLMFCYFRMICLRKILFNFLQKSIL